MWSFHYAVGLINKWSFVDEMLLYHHHLCPLFERCVPNIIYLGSNTDGFRTLVGTATAGLRRTRIQEWISGESRLKGEKLVSHKLQGVIGYWDFSWIIVFFFLSRVNDTVSCRGRYESSWIRISRKRIDITT